MQKMRNMDTAINDYTEVAIRKQWELFIQRGDKLGHSEGKLRRSGIQKNGGFYRLPLLTRFPLASLSQSNVFPFSFYRLLMYDIRRSELFPAHYR